MNIDWSITYGDMKDVYIGKIDGFKKFEIHRFKNKLSCFLLFEGSIIARDPTIEDAMRKASKLWEVANTINLNT